MIKKNQALKNADRDTRFEIRQHTTRHIDRKHPHCHIVFNHVDNDGKTISDKNDFCRNEKACKMLTAKYRLHFANDKGPIKEERLHPYDRAKHEIYRTLSIEDFSGNTIMDCR